MRLRRIVGTAGAAMVATLAFGVATAAAATQPGLVGAVQDTTTGPNAYALSGTVGVATQNTAGGWYAYAPSYYSNELTAISMANPAAPTIAGSGAPSGTQLFGAVTVNIFGGIAYVVSKNLNGSCTGPVGGATCDVNDNGEGNALTLFDVSTSPQTPTYLGSIQDTSDGGGTGGVSDGGKALFGAYGVTVTTINGTPYALVAAQGCLSGQPCPDSTVGNDLAVIDVSTPGSPTLVGSVGNTVGPTFDNDLLHATAVAVSGNYAYVTAFYGDALTVVDISNPTNPTVVAELQNTTDFPAPSDVAIQGNYAYVINQNGSTSSPGTLTVVNISNPLNPVVVSRANALGLSGGYRIRVSGDFAYVAARNVNAVTPVDISNPAAPYVITSVVSSADVNKTTGLDLMILAGNEYVVAASPYLSTEPNYTYPTFPAPGNSAQTNTGTISAIQLDPVANTVAINPSSEPGTSGTPFTTSTSANFTFTTGDTVSTVACSLDGSAYAPCTTLASAQYTGLAVGQHTFTVQSTDAAGNNSTASYSWTIQAPPPPPANTALPVVTGSTVVGGKLTATAGSWSGSPTSFSYQWQRCNSRGSSCVGLKTTGTSYAVGTIDVGDTLRAVVTAGNISGSASAVSAATPVVKACGGRGKLPAYCRVPQLEARPQVTGTTKVGQRLVADTGTWSTLAASAYGGPQLPTLKSQWLRCNAHGAVCDAIPGATGAVYRAGSKDLGHTLKLQVVARNRNGSAEAVSMPSGVIVAAATKLTLSVKFSPSQPLVRHGYVVAAVKSNVSAYLDAFFAVQIGNGNADWTTGTPAQGRAGRYLQFKIKLSRGEARSLRAALAHHEQLTAAVQGVYLPFPQHPGSVQTKLYKFHPKR